MRRNSIIAVLFICILFLSTKDVNATYYQPEKNLHSITSSASITPIDAGHPMDAYDAVAEYGPNHALASIQGTFHDLTAAAHTRYQLNASASTNVDMTYTLMAELFAIDGAYVQAEAYISIWQYSYWNSPYFDDYRLDNYWGYPGVIMSDKITLHPTSDPVTNIHEEYINKEIEISLASNAHYVVDLQVFTRGRDWIQPVYNGPITEYPDAFYSAAAYVDPVFTALNPNATITLSQIPGDQTLYHDEDPTSTLGIPNPYLQNPVPEPATMLLLGSGLIGLAGFRKRFRKR